MYKFKATQIRILKFISDRKWKNTPEDLAKSVVIEAAELLEHFQWDRGSSKSWEEKLKEKNLEEVGAEAADIFIYLIQFCNKMNIDLLEATNQKLDKQAIKYPIEEMLKDTEANFIKSERGSIERLLKLKYTRYAGQI